MLKKHNLSILGLLEVKVRVDLVDRLMETKFPGMSFFHNFLLWENSRILVMWDSSVVKLDLVDMSAQEICVRVTCLLTHRSFEASFIYALNTPVERRLLWDSLKSRGEGISLPWLLLGDFNCVRFPHERSGGAPIAPREMVDLASCVSQLELSDVNHVGCFFTWFNSAISSKLDRFMVNHLWHQSNLDVFSEFVAPGCFLDHALL
ncbi:uncharacterized protein [Henckelia pumila]|uniref:uncharacterized protein n=1 Tax=Henckelia pumila TaxID=405737 RepID=UPI003C6E92E9